MIGWRRSTFRKRSMLFTPHLTLAVAAVRDRPRAEAGRPERQVQNLQEKLAALPAPEFGTMTVREFFLYQSRLSPGGSKYTKLAELLCVSQPALVPTLIIIARIFFQATCWVRSLWIFAGTHPRGEDVRQSGSGNIGATNVSAHLQCTRNNMTCCCLDALKGTTPALVIFLMIRTGASNGANRRFYLLCPCHSRHYSAYSVTCSRWLRFHGGKGVAPGGVFAYSRSYIGVNCCGDFYRSRNYFRYVSLGSILAVASFPFLCVRSVSVGSHTSDPDDDYSHFPAHRR